LNNGSIHVELYKDVVEPPLIEDQKSHFVACWLYDKGKQ
jgi:hypothetical protein